MVSPIARSFYVNTDRGRVKGYRYGNADAPAMVVQGGISATGELWKLDGSGWWQTLYPLFADNDRIQVLSFDYLGGLGGSDLPQQCLTVAEHAQAYQQALSQLGIQQLRGWLGGSFGGILGLQAAALRQGPVIERLAVLGAAHKPAIQSTLLRAFQQLLLQNADNEQQAIVLARALAMVTYRSADEFEQRFTTGDEALQYVLAQGERLLQRHGRQASQIFTQLTPALNDYQVPVADVNCPVQLVSFSGDSIAPPSLIHELSQQLPDCRRLLSIKTHYGHDGFIKNVADYQPSLSQFFTQLTTTEDHYAEHVL
ncbi:MAG: alpha/beta fold hydrolase [Pseudomonadota bacterium]